MRLPAFWKPAAFAHPGPVEHCKTEQRDGGDRRGELRQARREQRGEFGEGQRQRGRRGGIDQPVGPADQQAGEIPERAAGRDVKTARLGHRGADLRDHIGAEQGVEPGHHPQEQDQPQIDQPVGDRARRAQDAAADHRPDPDGEAEGEAKHLEQVAGLARVSFRPFSPRSRRWSGSERKAIAFGLRVRIARA